MPQSSQADRRNGESRAALSLPTGESGSPPCCGKGVCIKPGTNLPDRKPFLAYEVAAASRVGWLSLMAPVLLSTPP